MKHAPIVCFSAAVTILAFSHVPLLAQTPSAGAPPATAQPAAKKPAAVFKQEELEQLVAPIALYPDAVLAQVFMASTYPLEIVLAARWVAANPQVKGEAITKAVEKEDWDPSVKSLMLFPDALTMMNKKIDWTQKLGDAFLAQQKEVMNAVQILRNKAKDAGNLKSGEQMVVKTEPAPAGPTTTQTIIIESKNPEVVYVPTYDPMTMYGPWPYAAYPPYYYYPPGYVAGGALFAFTAGVIVGGALWGNCNWGGGDININRNTNINGGNRNNINGGNRNNVNGGNTNVGNGNRGGGNGNSWQHNPEHRKGAEYRDSATQDKFGRGSSQQGTKSREEFRGRAEQGRQDISRGDMSRGDASRGGAAQSREFGGADGRNPGGGQTRDFSSGSSGSRGASSSRSSSSSAFSGGSGSSARASSSRGGASRGGGGGRGGGGRR